MTIERQIPRLELILSGWKDVIGDDFDGYRNHAYRMVNYCLHLKNCSEEEKEKIYIAAAFHDLGIWIGGTVDHIPPSIPPAVEYLKNHDMDSWIEEITLMISEHHKIRKYDNDKYPLVELFRKGDIIDLSFGKITFSVPKDHIKNVKEKFPGGDFHKSMRKKAVTWVKENPLNPVPMVKW